MKLVRLPDTSSHPLAFWLAMEEWIASRMADKVVRGDCFFIWQPSDTTVIIGRNQMLESEVNTNFCESEGIALVRRKSGGGAVISDDGNLMMSYITQTPGDVSGTFCKYTSMVVKSLRELDLNASDNSRNDILIGDRKISGNSFYLTPSGISIVHGTMLYDCNHGLISKALTPSISKLSSHGVRSVSSRVTSVKEYLPFISLSELCSHLTQTIPDEPIPVILSAQDVEEIEELAKRTYTPAWLSGNNPKGTLTASGRIDGVGEMNLFISLSKGFIKDINVTGDYLEIGDAGKVLSDTLTGLPLDKTLVHDALTRSRIEAVIPGLTPERLTAHIFT
ncbi:MAG: lipoyltransferase [Muribaculaceae bacterium]|nr:lipoyltransferase [Muribaculaceae bacterium]